MTHVELMHNVSITYEELIYSMLKHIVTINMISGIKKDHSALTVSNFTLANLPPQKSNKCVIKQSAKHKLPQFTATIRPYTILLEPLSLVLTCCPLVYDVCQLMSNLHITFVNLCITYLSHTCSLCLTYLQPISKC